MNELGDALKLEREKRNISLAQISAKTNITMNALTALENGRFSEIPGGFYFKNYLKSYLQAIDADVEVFLETHKEKLAGSYNVRTESTHSYCTKLKYSRFKKRNILFIILTIVVLSVLIFYLVYSKKEAIVNGWNELNKKPGTISTLSTLQAMPQSGIDFNALHSQEYSNRDYAPLNVIIEFSGRCWVLVNRGKVKIIEKTFQKGEKLKASGYDLTVYLDNPAGVRFLLNGKEVTYLKRLTQPEKIKITPVTIEKLFEY